MEGWGKDDQNNHYQLTFTCSKSSTRKTPQEKGGKHVQNQQ